MNKRVLAIDFGASSGRAIIGSFDGEKISLEEVHRFSNDPVKVGDTMYWDVLRLFYNIKQGIVNAKLAGGLTASVLIPGVLTSVLSMNSAVCLKIPFITAMKEQSV